MPKDPARRRLGVRFDEAIWSEATRGFSGTAHEIAVTARRSLEQEGVALDQLPPCEEHGPDRTELAGCAKLYLPAGAGRLQKDPSPSYSSSPATRPEHSSSCS